MTGSNIAGALLLLVGACTSRDHAEPATEVAPTSPEPTTSATEDPPLKEHMQEHFTAIRKIERALVGGDLAIAKDRAKWLGEHQPHDALEAWEPHLEKVREAALALTEAADLESAAHLAAALGSECAACHVTNTAITSFSYEDLPPAGPDNKSMMHRHQWAADRLWEGLIGPSESSWSLGAATLAAAPFVPQVTLGEDDQKTIEGMARTVQALGKESTRATREERAAIYGKLLTTCSGCHAIARE